MVILSRFLEILKNIIPKSSKIMPSQLYTHLQGNIANLVTQFRDFPMADVNMPENQTKLRALHILIHAEIETYFEQLGIYVLDAHAANTLNKKQKDKINYSVICYGQAVYVGDVKTIVERINSNISQVRIVISENNGIKAKNILKILLPLNYPASLLNQTWLTTMDTFGTRRGNYVHNAIHKINQLIGYNYIDAAIQTIILPEILQIDNYYVLNFGLV